jgi:hypothetical protein
MSIGAAEQVEDRRQRRFRPKVPKTAPVSPLRDTSIGRKIEVQHPSQGAPHAVIEGT